MKYGGTISMLVEVFGINYKNKGALLMLRAVQQVAAQWGWEVAISFRVGNFAQRTRDGLHHLIDLESTRLSSVAPLWIPAARYLPPLLKRRWRLASRWDVSAVLDSSGFAYSDQWGPRHSQRMLAIVENWKKRGKKIVLLPQAFGPFENATLRSNMGRILESVDIVFARDQTSYEHLRSVSARDDNIRLAPDFTNLVDGTLRQGTVIPQPAAIFIPNSRMIDKTEPAVRDAYLPFLIRCVGYLRNQNLNPVFILHETGDRSLAEALVSLWRKPIDIVHETDPLLIKGLLGQAHVVIGSRYHGLVGALSQAVPALGLGWSHKYDALFADYGCPDLSISPLDAWEDVRCKIDRMVDPASRRHLVTLLTTRSEQLRQASRDMWSKVYRFVNG